MKKKRAKAKRGIPLSGKLIDEALNDAARDAVQQHKKAGLPLAVWKDGKTVWIEPGEVEEQQQHRSHR